MRLRGRALTFESKFTQAVGLITSLGVVFPRVPMLVVTDSWFGNNGLLKPLRQALGARAQLLSRLRVNAVLHDRPVAVPGRAGRPRKYGERLGSVKAVSYTHLDVYKRQRQYNNFINHCGKWRQRGTRFDPT